MTSRLLILIPAHNESAVIAQTVAAVKVCLADSDRLIVIDDGSTDDTAALAEQAGAQVARRLRSLRSESEGSKGEVLHWWVQTFERELALAEGVIILDADSLIDPNFINAMRARLAGGAQAVQGFINPVGASGVATYSTLLEQRLADRVRSRLGWPVRLRGTGMAFAADLLPWLVDDLHTQVEDVELSLRLAERGIKVAFAPEAIVDDGLPPTSAAAVRQRARWLRGQAQVWRHYGWVIASLLLRGPWAWSLLGSLLLKPYSLMFGLKVSLGVATLLLTSVWPPLVWLAVALALWLVVDGAYWLSGLWVLGEPLLWLRRLAATPAFGLVWLRSLKLALSRGHGWLRAR